MGVDFPEFIQWCFYSFISGCAVYLVSILGGIKTSIERLNVQIAVVINRQETHDDKFRTVEDQINKLDDRTIRLERKEH
jgi:hypothetical protein